MRLNIIPPILLTFLLVVSTMQLHCQDSTEYRKFLDLFPWVAANQLHIYSPCELPKGKKFEGRLIDNSFHKYFSFDTTLTSNLNSGWHVFSCFKFKHSVPYTALIVRTPSQYRETSIDLFLWDDQKKKLVKRIELADAFGDGLWNFVKDAWLVSINGDALFDIVIRKKDRWHDGPNSPEQISDTVKVLIGTRQDFKLLKTAVDKGKFELMNWKQN